MSDTPTAREQCGATYETDSGEYVSPCCKPKGHPGDHEGTCLGSVAVWANEQQLPTARERAEALFTRRLETGGWVSELPTQREVEAAIIAAEQAAAREATERAVRACVDACGAACFSERFRDKLVAAIREQEKPK